MKLDRLKSLPLTIGLTLLIWLYAESQVRTAPENDSQMVVEVPVLVAGPPELTNAYDVFVDPGNVNVSISGTQDRLHDLDKRAVSAYLDVDWGDRSVVALTRKSLRVTVPSGIVVTHPVEVKYRLSEKTSATHRAGG